MIRIAAAGDIHYDRNSGGKIKNHVEKLGGAADLLVLAGDLTQTGSLEEARLLARDLKPAPVPVVAVLGNHDFQMDQSSAVAEILDEAGVKVLEGDTCEMQIQGCSVGIAGHKGFCGGFIGACGSDFGEPEMKSFIRHTKAAAEILHGALVNLATDYRIALLHYAPIEDTLLGERREIYPFLGSYLLAQAIDDVGCDVIFHGHAHKGVEKGSTPGGIPVRNVAQPVIRHTFNIYTLNKDDARPLASALGDLTHGHL